MSKKLRGRVAAHVLAPVQQLGGSLVGGLFLAAAAQLRVPLMRQLLLVPSGDVFFAGDNSETSWQINTDVVVRPDELGGLYGGVGAAFLRADFDGDDDEEVEAGYNLFAGLEGARLLDTRVRPFAEARWSWVDDFDPFRLVIGINTPVR